MALASELDTLYLAATAALDADDYDSAIRAAMKAQLKLSMNPDSRSGEQSLGWPNLAAIDAFIAKVERLKNIAARTLLGPWSQSKMKYAGAASSDDGL